MATKVWIFMLKYMLMNNSITFADTIAFNILYSLNTALIKFPTPFAQSSFNVRLEKQNVKLGINLAKAMCEKNTFKEA